ncbi:hypothetical protein DUI87_09227 [Hirundo rustica rustica]|uniref:Uncharacterized protein n=1 Tax=Hirundo rustica rustica TaxID=333673 RepID=A0A3M0KLK9_HIRRU|nr:hypothetical protein DUI87_09227 [Hirundo rustica rustica]
MAASSRMQLDLRLTPESQAKRNGYATERLKLTMQNPRRQGKMSPSSKEEAELYNTVQQSPLKEHRSQKLQLRIVYPQLPHLWKPYCSKINADTPLQYTATLSGRLKACPNLGMEAVKKWDPLDQEDSSDGFSEVTTHVIFIKFIAQIATIRQTTQTSLDETQRNINKNIASGSKKIFVVISFVVTGEFTPEIHLLLGHFKKDIEKTSGQWINVKMVKNLKKSL